MTTITDDTRLRNFSYTCERRIFFSSLIYLIFFVPLAAKAARRHRCRRDGAASCPLRIKAICTAQLYRNTPGKILVFSSVFSVRPFLCTTTTNTLCLLCIAMANSSPPATSLISCSVCTILTLSTDNNNAHKSRITSTLFVPI